nr:uncharacterized protein LOC127333932 [Lolium perenne]
MRPTRWWRAISPREKFSLCGALQPRAPSPRRRNPPHFPLTVLSSTPRSARRSAADPLSSASSARLVPSPVAGLTPCRRSATDSVKVRPLAGIAARGGHGCFGSSGGQLVPSHPLQKNSSAMLLTTQDLHDPGSPGSSTSTSNQLRTLTQVLLYISRCLE